MKRRSLIVFTGDPLEDYGSVLLDFCLWELCFSLVSPLWESCYSLASRKGMRSEGAAHFLCRFLCFLFFFLFLSFSSPSPSFSFSLPPFLLFFHISFSFFPFLTHKLFPSLFSSSPLFHLFPFLLLPLCFFFFLRELLVLCASKM